MKLLNPQAPVPMRNYRRLEAYNLTRSLLAGVCAAADPDTAADLRHAAATATARILEASARDDDRGVLADLAAASQALNRLAEEIPAYRRDGRLTPQAAELLLARRSEAARALETLITLTPDGDDPDSGAAPLLA